MNINADELEGFVEMDFKEVTIHPDRFRALNQEAVDVVAESIEVNGQLQPILVTPNGDLIDGNHRLHACKQLGIKVQAKIVNEMDISKLELMEIDTNLCRKELSETELEQHLFDRKRIYNDLYPDTAKRGAKGEGASGMPSFGESTALLLSKSQKSIERLVKRGAIASETLQKARDEKVITTGDIDTIIKDTGDDKEAQEAKMKELIKQKAEKVQKKKEEPTADANGDAGTAETGEVGCEAVNNKALIDQASEIQVLKKEVKALEAKLTKANKTITTRDNALEKAKTSVKTLQERIAKAKIANPEIKI